MEGGLRDAGLLGRVAKKKAYLRLAKKKKRLRWAKEHRNWTEEHCLEGQHPGVAYVDVETGVLRVLFNEAASLGLMRCLFLKLDTLMYLSSLVD